MAAVAPTTSNSMIRQVSANPPASEAATRSLPVPAASATYQPQGPTYQIQGTTYPSTQGTTYPAPTIYPSTQGTTYPAPTTYPSTQGTTYPAPTTYPSTQGTTYPAPTTYPSTQGTTYPSPTTYPSTQGTTYPAPTQVTTSYPTSYPSATITTSVPREHTTIQGTTTMTTSYPGTTGSLAPHDSAIQNAINQGRIYSPMDAVYVPSGLALKSSMHTIYDSKMIPTFEAPLTFQSHPSTLVTGPLIQHRGVTEASSHVTGKSNKFVVTHQKKSACC